MPLVNMKDMLRHAHAHEYAVGAFDLVGLDFLQGIMDAAERSRAPVILSLAESHFGYFDFELLMPAVEKAAKRATVPVAIHLDHGASQSSAVRAINLGCNGIMVDSSDQPLVKNIQQSRQVVEMAHGCGVSVEGELGYVPGVEGEDAERHPGKITYTSVDDARTYVQQTGVDFLAISIGNIHGRMRGEPKLDFERLARINQTLGIPLVLHGGTGLDAGHYQRLIENGVAKINYYTALSDAAAAVIRDNSGKSGGYTALLKGAPEAIAREVEHCMRLWNCAGRAAEILAHCEPWLPVEHLIIYNVEGLDEAGVAHMMAEGQRVLSAIPGVRELTTGEAVKQDAAYRYTWLVRFCHPAVIDSYREHPDHVAFANNLFRPVAGGRVSIDYKAVAPPLPGNKTAASATIP
jgi:fructose-bisphosphate aldolase class II